MDRAPRHQAMVDFPQYKKREYVVLEEDHDKALAAEESKFKSWQASHHANYVAACEERDKLRAFALAMIGMSADCGGADGADIQEMGVRFGLLRMEEREDRCTPEGKHCACAEFGFPITCYRPTELLIGPQPEEEPDHA